ncbi:hypothetical protein CHS0354_022955 [Potamilus streckersoni]|uniref:Uncharacterized protein n=1 Tax=Potamilus streckersoni TaxID=2493646 RepID=A0AAE0S5I7_9BIVA|nr:hypothetical protein CHS0354_022955 [Potamilus streckersoni]
MADTNDMSGNLEEKKTTDDQETFKEDENEINIVEDEKENRPINNPKNTEKPEKLVPHREAIKIDLTTLHSHYRTHSLSSLPHVLTEYGLEDKTVRFQKRRKKKKRNNKTSDESEDEEAYRFQRSRRMEERYDEQVDFVEEVQKKVEKQRQKMKLRQEAEQRKFEEFMRAEIEKRHHAPKRLERKELTHDDGFIKNIKKSRVSKILALEAKMKNEGKLKTQTEIDNFWEDMKNPDIFNAYFTQPTMTDNSSTVTAMTGMTASNQSIVSNLAASHQESHPPRSLSHISERHDEIPTPQTGRDKWAITQQFQHKHHSEATKHKRPTSSQIAKEAALDLEKRCPKLEMPPLWCFTMDLGEKPPDPEEIQKKVELKLREKNRKIFQRKLRKMHQLAMANSAAANRILAKRGDLTRVLEGSTLRDVIAYFNVDNEEEETHSPSPVLPLLRPSSEKSQMVLAVTNEGHDDERHEVSIDKRGSSVSTVSRPTSKKLSRGSKRSHHKTPEALPPPTIPYKPSPLTLNELEHTGKVMEAKCMSTLWVNYMRSGKSVFSQS